MDDNAEYQDFALTESDAQLSADEEQLLDELGLIKTVRKSVTIHLLRKERINA